MISSTLALVSSDVSSLTGHLGCFLEDSYLMSSSAGQEHFDTPLKVVVLMCLKNLNRHQKEKMKSADFFLTNLTWRANQQMRFDYRLV